MSEAWRFALQCIHTYITWRVNTSGRWTLLSGSPRSGPGNVSDRTGTSALLRLHNREHCSRSGPSLSDDHTSPVALGRSGACTEFEHDSGGA